MTDYEVRRGIDREVLGPQALGNRKLTSCEQYGDNAAACSSQVSVCFATYNTLLRLGEHRGSTLLTCRPTPRPRVSLERSST